MKRLFTVVILLGFISHAIAQQDPQFSQNMFNKLFVNPGTAGANDAICGTLLYRSQWTNFDGAPKTGLLSIDAAINPIKGGLGLTVVTDEIGFENTLNAKLAYAFRFDVGQASKVGIGIDAGLIQKSIDGTFKFNDANDPSIPTGSVSGSSFDLGAGLYFQSEKAYLGFSATHLLEPEIDYGDFTTTMAMHMYGMAAYRFDVSPSISLTPSAHVKNDGATTQADLNVNAMFLNKFWLGGSYRLEDAIVLMAGVNVLQNLKIGYAFDITTSDLKSYNDGTHEIMLNYCYKIAKKKLYPIKNVRFL